MRKRVAFFSWAALVAGLAMQIGVGASIAWGLDTALWRWHQGSVDASIGAVSSQISAYRVWVGGPLGGTIAAWALLMWWLAWGPLRRGERWAARAMASSTVAWLLLDTPTSFVHQVWVNVAFNAFAGVMILAPLALMWWAREDWLDEPRAA